MDGAGAGGCAAGRGCWCWEACIRGRNLGASGSPHVYTGVSPTAAKFDRSGHALLQPGDGRVYNADGRGRRHLLGDRDVSARAANTSKMVQALGGDGLYTDEPEALRQGLPSAPPCRARRSRRSPATENNRRVTTRRAVPRGASYDPDHVPDVASNLTGSYIESRQACQPLF